MGAMAGERPAGPFVPERELVPGDLVGERYRIVRRIGKGGMGTVYEAEHLMLRRHVALKVIARQHSLDARHVERFRREARVAAQLRHPNVVEVIDLGQADGREYLAMELLEGMDLCDAIQLAEGYDPLDTVPILDQVLGALEAAHGAGLVHRDLKPENIFLAQAPDGELTVRLLDFGVVKVPEGGAQAQLTRTGMVVGTPDYMAPEQATGSELDARADLYALGCIAFAMVCGRPPFRDRSVLLLMAAHVTKPPPLPSSLREGLSPAVDEFILRALQKDPARRYASAAEMRSALHRMAHRLGAQTGSQRRIVLPANRGGTVSDTFDERRKPAAPAAAERSSTMDTPTSVLPAAPRTAPATDAVSPPPPVRPPRRLSPLILLLALAGAAGAGLVTYFLLRAFASP
jgi:serine/threonine-protein kinase